MLVQVRLAVYGLRYLSLVLFVGSNGEVRLRFATPDVLLMQVQTNGVGGSQVPHCSQTGQGSGFYQPPSLIPPAVL